MNRAPAAESKQPHPEGLHRINVVTLRRGGAAASTNERASGAEAAPTLELTQVYDALCCSACLPR